jgi:hypothetical protein
VGTEISENSSRGGLTKLDAIRRNRQTERVVSQKSKSNVDRIPNGELVCELALRYGPMIGGRDLIQALGCSNGQAFKQAIRQDRLGVRIFNLPARRGKFALTKDVANWLSTASVTGVSK